MNIYNEQRPNTPTSNPHTNPVPVNATTIGFDLSDSTLTLKRAIDLFKQSTDHLPSEHPLLIYMVCGMDFKFVDLIYFFDYLESTDFKEIRYSYRGVLHCESFKLVFDPHVNFIENSDLYYVPNKLHLIVSDLLTIMALTQPVKYNKFMDVFNKIGSLDTPHLVSIKDIQKILLNR